MSTICSDPDAVEPCPERIPGSSRLEKNFEATTASTYPRFVGTSTNCSANSGSHGGSHPHSHSVEHLLEHLHPLLFSLLCLSCFVTLGCFVISCVCLLLAMLLFHGFLGPNPWLFYFLHGHLVRVSFNQKSMISMPTSPSESLLLFNPWNQLNFDVTGFKNTQASRDNRS